MYVIKDVYVTATFQLLLAFSAIFASICATIKAP